VSKDAPFTLVLTDDNYIAVDVSDDFISLSTEEQLKVMENFFWEKNLAPQSTVDVSQDAILTEYTILIAETIMSQLKDGIRFTNDGKIDINLNNLENLGTILR
jgi:hypothetical protein